MNKSLFLLLVCLLLGLAACSSGDEEPAAVEEPVVEATEQVVSEPTEEPEPTDEPAPEPTEEPEMSGAVSTLEDVQSATVQIVATGTFVDPDGFQTSSAGSGTGFIIDESGIAVTNNHVVAGAAKLEVYVGGSAEPMNARVLGASECADLAVIDISGDAFPYLDWYTDDLKVGLDIYAAGFPLGDPEFTLTRGIVSKARAGGESEWASVDAVIEHDATINPGNSGGPLVTTDGQVVAVNYAGNSSTNQYFAIAYREAISIIEQLTDGDIVDSLGINAQAVVGESLSGIWAASVESGSPADQAGIQGGDIITTLEDLQMGSDGTMADYCDVLRSHTPDDTLNVQVVRFETGEILEGQINGDEMAVVYSGSETEAVSDDGGTTEEVATSTDSGYTSVQDDFGAIQVSVPAQWANVSTEQWVGSWGDFDFTAANIVASADISAFYDSSISQAGVDYAASTDWGRLGGYVQLLDATKGWYDECTFDSREPYEDVVFEGQSDIWDCGADGIVVTLAARPKADPTAYLALLIFKAVEEADFDILTEVLNTFDVVGDLP